MSYESKNSPLDPELTNTSTTEKAEIPAADSSEIDFDNEYTAWAIGGLLSLAVVLGALSNHFNPTKTTETHPQPTHKVEKVCPVEKPTCSPSLQKSIHSTRFNITSEKI